MHLRFHLRAPQGAVSAGNTTAEHTIQSQLDSTEKKEAVATREVYGKVLAQLAEQDQTIYALDAEVKNSTYAIDFKNAHPSRW